MFNSTSKNERKNVNVVNQNRDDASGTACLSIGNSRYFINRTLDKYTRRLKGEVSIEAKTNLDFYKIDDSTGEKIELNGLTRNDTDKNIRKNLWHHRRLPAYKCFQSARQLVIHPRRLDKEKRDSSQVP